MLTYVADPDPSTPITRITHSHTQGLYSYTGFTPEGRDSSVDHVQHVYNTPSTTGLQFRV